MAVAKGFSHCLHLALSYTIFRNMFLALLLLAAALPLSMPQCLTATDDVRQISTDAHQALLQAEQHFSADLLQTIGSLNPDKNVFFSPSSIYRTMLLAYFVSANHTEAAIKKSLHLPEDKDKLDIVGAYNLENYYQKLRSIQTDYQLSSANRMYVSKYLRVSHCMKVLFADEIVPANFRENLNHVLKKINNWVATQTRNVIKDFLSEDYVTSQTELVLINAAYFKGTWKCEFPKEDTSEGIFYLSNGKSVPVTMMFQENRFRVGLDMDLGVEVLELPYTGDDISMFVMLPLKPSPSAVPELLKRLNSETLQKTFNETASQTLHKIAVTIPKFSIEETIELTPILESMGVGDMFESTADLSTLTESPAGLSFSDAIHKAKIQVDEQGTEAAAATAIISARIGIDPFIADRPFVYFLYDKVSNIVLFCGIFNSP
uniref:Serpin domain-containing protein n=1 Tax=Cuerna arida TaxID=1464854 RepID=A0A1B6GCF0_9HEMI